MIAHIAEIVRARLTNFMTGAAIRVSKLQADFRSGPDSSEEEGRPSAPSMLIEDAPDFGDPRLNDLLALWYTKCDGRPLPERCDFSLRELACYLNHIVFVDVPHLDAPAESFRIGFAGAAIVDVLGPCSDKKLSEHFPPAMCAVLGSAFARALSRRAPVGARGALVASGRPHLAHETLVAPLVGDESTPAVILSAIYFKSAVAQA